DVPDDILKELDAQTKAANIEMERQRKENERREQQALKEHRKRKQRQDMYASRPKKTREIIAETSHGNYTIKYELRSQAQITGRSRTFHRGGLVRSGSSFNLSLLKLKRALLKI
ncbi:hypothetical protein IIC68_01975, partial [archaeon]|nr:hypothetical protein [archaeon]